MFLLRQFSLVKDLYLDFLMTASSIAGAWMSCCGWDSGSCNWMSACHGSTLLLIFPIKLLLESCQVPTALVPSLQPPPIPFLPNQDKMQRSSHVLCITNTVSISAGWKSRVGNLKDSFVWECPDLHNQVCFRKMTRQQTYPVDFA